MDYGRQPYPTYPVAPAPPTPPAPLPSRSGRSRAVIFAAIVLLGVGAGILTITQPWKRPSEEMVSLRQVEQRLGLPPAQERTEADRGPYEGEDKVRHYERHITNSYDGVSPVQAAAAGLPAKGWVQINSAEFQGVQAQYFVNQDLRACVVVRQQPRSDEPRANSIILQHRADDGCKGNFSD